MQRLLGFVFCFAFVLSVGGLAGCAKSESGTGESHPDLRHNVGKPDAGGDLARASDLASGKDAGPPDLLAVDLVTIECGDDICNGGEDCTTCPADCGDCTVCPAGFGDCDGSPGTCETNLNTASNCGGCGIVCLQTGGTNACVLVGDTYVCQPTCAAGHDDCDLDPRNGCEADTDEPANCGECGRVCANPHGTTVCTTTGSDFFCSPNCAAGWAACGTADEGCTTDVSSDPDQCGNCGRVCAATNTTSRACVGGSCDPTCASGFADCDTPLGGSPDNGCEVDGKKDRGEPDNVCPGRAFSVAEYSSASESLSRLVVPGDKDTYRVNFNEADHFCFPGTSQSYNVLVQISGAGAEGATINYNLDSCNNSWQTLNSQAICIYWNGTCSATDSRSYYFQVTGANSCSPYTFTWQYCGEGTTCPGC